MRFLFKRKVYLPIYFILAVHGILFVDHHYSCDGSLAVSAIISALLIFFIFTEKLLSRNKYRNFFEPDFIFAILFSLFHFAYIWLYSIGISEYDSEVFYNPETVPPAVYYCTICLIFFLIGYGSPFRYPLNLKPIDRKEFVKTVYHLSKILICICILFFWGGLLSVGPRIFSDYKLLLQVGELSYFGKFFCVQQYLGVGGISMYCLSSGYLHKKFMAGNFKYMALFYIIGYLIIGDRGGFILLAVIPAIIFNLFQKRLSVKMFTAAIFILLFISSYVSFSRTLSIYNPIDILRHYHSNKEISPVLRALNEFGASLKTVSIAIYLVPDYYGYQYGKSYLHALSIVIPNFFEKRDSVGSPGAWLTETAFGDLHKTHGRGGSIAMEAYLNFGFVFGAFTFLFLGYFIKKMYSFFLKKPTILSGILFLSVTSSLSLWIRNTSAIVPRTVIWSLIVILIIRHFIHPQLRKSKLKKMTVLERYKNESCFF